jgi:PTH1 family peptidyl-tRNA hydrolase
LAGIKLIVGLGNPGREYESTRHNAGSWLVGRFAARSNVGLKKDAHYFGMVGRVEGPAGAVFLLVPTTFMNASGRSLGALAGFFKIPAEQILVVHDELDFAPGTARMKLGGGVAGHNGLKDIAARLGTHDFWRLRLGIGHPGERGAAVADYVLSKPSQEDRVAIEGAIERALEFLPQIVAGDLQGAMQKLHTQEKEREKEQEAEKEKQKEKEVKEKAATPPIQAAPVPSPLPAPAEPLPAPEKPAAEKKGAVKSFLKKLLKK